MSIMKFDTLSAAKELQGFGFEQRQAEGVVELMRKTTEAGSEGLATKGDLKEVETALRSDLKDVESSLNAKIDKVEIALIGKIDTLRAETTSLKWILGVLTAAVFS
ncbi:MAG: CCDC90 family protein, partial [Helicobacteraceae bacterium]|nr:CCDC90 family protein [Helicobacteraceae bacterium]